MNRPQLSHHPRVEQGNGLPGASCISGSCRTSHSPKKRRSTDKNRKATAKERKQKSRKKGGKREIYRTGRGYLRGILREGGSRPYVPIQDLRGAGQGRIYTRINAPGEIPLSASGDKYYKLGWLLSFPSLSLPCRLHETPNPPLSSSTLLSRRPPFCPTQKHPFSPARSSVSAVLSVPVHKATPREQENSGEYISPSFLPSSAPALLFLSPFAINLHPRRGWFKRF